MCDTLFENERYRVIRDKKNLRIFIYFNISRSLPPEQDDELMLSYSQWNNLVSAIQKTNGYLKNPPSKEVKEGNVKICGLNEHYLEVMIGNDFNEYFHTWAYSEFANLIEKANNNFSEKK